jgi:4-hydroxy-4-methyl-2-oxoglutarate aldolase
MGTDDRYCYDLPAHELIRRLTRLGTGAVCDALVAVGLPSQVLACDLKPIRQDMVVAGPAFTLKGFPDRFGDIELRRRRLRMFTDMRALVCPVVDVRDCTGDTQVAHYGEMNAVVGRACGAIGALVDGGCRDTGLLLHMDFPVICRYLTPVEAYRRWSYYEWQVPITLRGASTTAVLVTPGDFVLADIDGSLVIPQQGVTAVLTEAEHLWQERTAEASAL